MTDDLFDALYKPWPDRETHSAYVHLTADRGLADTAVESVAAAQAVDGAVNAEQAGQILAGLLERPLGELDDAGLADEHRTITDDIGAGSVDWTALGAHLLKDAGAWQSMPCRCGCEQQT